MTGNPPSTFSPTLGLTKQPSAAELRAEGTLLEAMSGIAPYPLDGLFSVSYKEESATRLSRYRLAQDFYKGDQFENMAEDGENLIVCNWCKHVVDVATDWFYAKGWKAVCVSGNELVAELLEQDWAVSDKALVTTRALQFGAITGDAYFLVSVNKRDVDGALLPKTKWTPRVVSVNPAHCFPFWNPRNPEELLQLLIQFPIPDPDDPANSEILLSYLITASEWKIWYDDKLVSRQPNPFKQVNAVHVPNFLLAASSFGQSDIHQIIPLNEEYNRALNQVRNITAYHGEPTTVVFGAKVGDLEKGAKKVWSNLPVDARVENLKMDIMPQALEFYLKELRQSIAVLSNTPYLLMNSEHLSISNTSGIALELLFQPLIQKTLRRRLTYTPGFQRVNVLLLKAHQLILGDNVLALADNQDAFYSISTEYTSALPRDLKSELDAAQMRMTMGIWSRAEAARRLSDVQDYSRLILELAADDRYKLATAYETQRANSGQSPTLSVVFLNSLPLSEDFEDIAEDMSDGPEPVLQDSSKDDSSKDDSSDKKT